MPSLGPVPGGQSGAPGAAKVGRRRARGSTNRHGQARTGTHTPAAFAFIPVECRLSPVPAALVPVPCTACVRVPRF
eukprot:846577-Prymnesium_polylepis.1